MTLAAGEPKRGRREAQGCHPGNTCPVPRARGGAGGGGASPPCVPERGGHASRGPGKKESLRKEDGLLRGMLRMDYCEAC